MKTDKTDKTPCAARIWVAGRRYNLRRVIVQYEPRPCSYTAREKVGPLDLCGVHARMAREGLVAPDGDTGDPGTRRDLQNSPSLRFTWATRPKEGT